MEEQSWFEVTTPLGFTVRTSEDYWKKLVEKHPDLEESLSVVQQALRTPSEVRRSIRDSGILIFYHLIREKRWMVTVVRRLNGVGFLVTAYQTDAIKKGEQVWTS
ncbi:MAG: hypothetical protein HC924_15695 [Synechococcaceae cyanobacterium SM2_3_2]|nr:hypothetical protein [Synechococcaceae cyanobacterium SM2_3_2]